MSFGGQSSHDRHLDDVADLPYDDAELAEEIAAGLHEPNPWTMPPAEGETLTVIGGQLCVWDADPLEEFGQVWIPVCVFCRRGPLEETKVACDDCLGKRPAVAIGGWL